MTIEMPPRLTALYNRLAAEGLAEPLQSGLWQTRDGISVYSGTLGEPNRIARSHEAVKNGTDTYTIRVEHPDATARDAMTARLQELFRNDAVVSIAPPCAPPWAGGPRS